MEQHLLLIIQIGGKYNLPIIEQFIHSTFSALSSDPQKYKGMMEKIKLSEVERGLPNGIIAQIRGLNTQGEGILEPLDSFLSDIL